MAVAYTGYLQPPLANNESAFAKGFLEARSAGCQDIVGYLITVIPGQQMPILERVDIQGNRYFSIFIKVSSVLSCQIHLENFTDLIFMQFKKFLGDYGSLPINLKKVRIGIDGGNYFPITADGDYGVYQPSTVFHSILSQAFVDVKDIIGGSVWYYDKLPSSIYLNVYGYVMWETNYEERQSIPSRGGALARLRRAIIESGGVKYHLAVWQEAIDPINVLLNQQERKPIKITAVHWYNYNGWQLETTDISNVGQ